MHFCEKCDNIYYIKISESDESNLVYYCRNCGFHDSTITSETCVYQSHETKTKNSYKNYLNEYTKLDPTLPRANNIPCPNPECKTNTSSAPKEVLYIRYNDTDLNYLYMCCSCDRVWTSQIN